MVVLLALTPSAVSGADCPTASTTGGDVLTVRFWRDDSVKLVARYGDDATVKGSLATTAGIPVAAATVCVDEALVGAGAAATIPRLGFASTNAIGNFRYRIPPGPSRLVRFTYLDGGTAISNSVTYLAHSRPSLNIAPQRTQNRGRPIRFWGRLPGPLASGHVVVLQAAAGRRWLTFETATTDDRGRYRAKYGFQRTARPTTYRFRVIVPRQAGYPWLRGQSRTVPVTVLP
jgi:hypothetical protein